MDLLVGSSHPLELPFYPLLWTGSTVFALTGAALNHYCGQTKRPALQNMASLAQALMVSPGRASNFPTVASDSRLYRKRS